MPRRLAFTNCGNCSCGYVGSNDWKDEPSGSTLNCPGVASVTYSPFASFASASATPSPSGVVKNPIFAAPMLAATTAASS